MIIETLEEFDNPILVIIFPEINLCTTSVLNITSTIFSSLKAINLFPKWKWSQFDKLYLISLVLLLAFKRTLSCPFIRFFTMLTHIYLLEGFCSFFYYANVYISFRRILVYLPPIKDNIIYTHLIELKVTYNIT